jgi:hypothetical protein
VARGIRGEEIPREVKELFGGVEGGG